MSLALTERQARDIEAFCQIARESGAVVSLRELLSLAAIDASEHELERAFDSEPKLKSKFQLQAGYVLERDPATRQDPVRAVEEEERRRKRALTNLRSASRFGTALTKSAVVVSVSGGNSYLSAKDDEDIDFFCVTKTGGMWWFLVKALMLARIHRLANSEVPVLCFSCVMDEDWATRKFMERQDPIFARDALMAKVIGGKGAYHSLLEQASWMGDYFPTFYGMKLLETSTGAARPTQVAGQTGAASKVMNSFLYHTVGSFLRAKSWVLNRKLVRAGWVSSVFATKVGPGCYIYESNGYRTLREMYGGLQEGREGSS